MTGSIKDLSQKYIELSKDDGDAQKDDDIGSLKDEMEKWKEKMSELDEEDRLHDIAENKYQEAKQKMQELEENREQLKEVQQELLRRIADRFVPQDEWLDNDTIKAVNKVLTGRTGEVIHVNDEEIDSSYSTEPEEIFEISERVRRLAKDKLGDTDEVKEFWDKFKGQKKFEPFEVLATTGKSLSREEIADKIDRDVSKGQVGANVRSTVNQTEFNPYDRQGSYSLSLTGEYMKEHFMDIESDKESTETESSEEDNEQKEEQSPSKSKSRQQKFYDTVSE
jgi:hypothetical protein